MSLLDVVLPFPIVELEPGAEIQLSVTAARDTTIHLLETDEPGFRALGFVRVTQRHRTRYHASDFPTLAEMNAHERGEWDRAFVDAPQLEMGDSVQVDLVNVSKERVQAVLVVRGTQVAS